MAMDSELTEAFNAQITLEYASAYQYLALGAWLESASLPGMASWMRIQAEEEWGHGMRFYQFVIDRDEVVRLGAIDQPDADFASVVEVFERALESERRVSRQINDLYALAMDKRDFASVPILDWFVNEQVEEEATVTQIIDDVRRAGTEGHAILMLDRELGERTAGD